MKKKHFKEKLLMLLKPNKHSMIIFILLILIIAYLLFVDINCGLVTQGEWGDYAYETGTYCNPHNENIINPFTYGVGLFVLYLIPAMPAWVLLVSLGFPDTAIVRLVLIFIMAIIIYYILPSIMVHVISRLKKKKRKLLLIIIYAVICLLILSILFPQHPLAYSENPDRDYTIEEIEYGKCTLVYKKYTGEETYDEVTHHAMIQCLCNTNTSYELIEKYVEENQLLDVKKNPGIAFVNETDLCTVIVPIWL